MGLFTWIDENVCLPIGFRNRQYKYVFLTVFCTLVIFFFGLFRASDVIDGITVSSRVFTDFDDVGCNGISLDARVREQQRILDSIRKELIDVSKRLQQINYERDQVTKEIPVKQAELKQLENEVENARNVLKDFNDKRNVHVVLPFAPLLPNETFSIPIVSRNTSSLEELINFSRCSITSFLRVYINPSSSSSLLRKAFESSPYVVSDPNTACLLLTITDLRTHSLPHNGTNHILINTAHSPISPQGNEIIVQSNFDKLTFRHSIDYNVYVNVNESTRYNLPQLFPLTRKNLIFLLAREEWPNFASDAEMLSKSGIHSEDTILATSCKKEPQYCTDRQLTMIVMKESMFTILQPGTGFQEELWHCLLSGSIPVVVSLTQPLPFEDTIDWQRVLYRIPYSRFSELHFLVRSIPMAERVEMKRRGRMIFEKYLIDANVLSRALLSSLRHRLVLPSLPSPTVPAIPLFDDSFQPPILTPVNQPVTVDEEYLGPLESAHNSPKYQHNFTTIQSHSYSSWNTLFSIEYSPEYLATENSLPVEAEQFSDTAIGYRPIAPGSGKEFSAALGGNGPREQFTVLLLTYNRDAVLAQSLERLHNCPYINKVLVVWNNVARVPVGAWPRLHVPVEFILAPRNSLNNRFVPWDRIETEAVLSLDDDIDLKQHEIVFAFRVWREHRDRIVGFPARYHSRYGDSVFYNSNHTCQLSMVLTGAAFIHKMYFHLYTHEMAPSIREHVDRVTNCEDIAMNFLVSHVTRQPPVKTTSKWTLKCANCMDSLWSDGEHFEERHTCIRLFTSIYGYNPLRYSQFRADSVLFKTRLPNEHQKCFRFV